MSKDLMPKYVRKKVYPYVMCINNNTANYMYSCFVVSFFNSTSKKNHFSQMIRLYDGVSLPKWPKISIPVVLFCYT